MDITTITQLIGSLGFPIVMCIYMVRFINTTLATVSKTIDDMKDNIAENTKMIETLIKAIGGGRNDS